jgi:hypothetical protein
MRALHLDYQAGAGRFGIGAAMLAVGVAGGDRGVDRISVQCARRLTAWETRICGNPQDGETQAPRSA